MAITRGELDLEIVCQADEDERRLIISGTQKTAHTIGKDPWWAVGIHLVATINTAFILGYPALIMAYLGWTWGIFCLIGGGILSFHNNCLLGDLHVLDGVRFIRYRDMTGHIYGESMYYATWIVQYFNLSVANVGMIILGGQSIKAIAGVTSVHLGIWILTAGIMYLAFATVVPNLSALRYFSMFSLLLSCIYTVIAIVISVKDGLHATSPRDYSLLGSTVDQVFNAIGALATTAFAFNTGILPELQATVRSPARVNIYKALSLQFTVGTLPLVLLTVVGYWAYGNFVYPYMIINLSGPSWAILLANITACLQALVVFHIFANPAYEFLDSFVAPKVALFSKFNEDKTSDYTMSVILGRFWLRGIYLGVSTFVGAMFPFFGNFIALTGALAAFSLQGGLIHHMTLKVRGNDFGKGRLAWHWINVVVNIIVTFATVAAAIHYIVRDSYLYHVFADI